MMSLAPLLCLLAAAPGGSSRTTPGDLFRYATVFDTNGRHIVGLTRSKELTVWDAKTGRIVRVLKGNLNPIYLARLTPDGEAVLGQSQEPPPPLWRSGSVAAKRSDHGMRLWSIRTCRLIWHIPNGLFDTFSRDGRRVYGTTARLTENASEKQKLVIWDLSTGRKAYEFQNYAPLGGLSNILEESADGRWLLYTDLVGAHVFDLRTRRRRFFLDAVTTRVVVPNAAMAGSGDRFFFTRHPRYRGSIVLLSIPSGEVLDRAVFPPTTVNGRDMDPVVPSLIGWLRQSEGFVAVHQRRWTTFRRGSGLADRGEVPFSPRQIVVSPDERSFAAWEVAQLGDKPKTFRTMGFDTATCTKRWERPGIAIMYLPTGELVLEDGGTVRFVDAVTGREKRAVRRAGF